MAAGRLTLGLIITPNPDFLANGFDKASRKLMKTKELLQSMADEVMVPSLTKNFEVGGRPSWAALSPVTLELRDRLGSGGGGGILDATGALKGDATGPWMVTDAAAVKMVSREDDGFDVASAHMKGTSRMPARPYLMFQEEDVEAIFQLAIKWVEEALIGIDSGGPAVVLGG